MVSHPAVFLDRDGTLLKEVPYLSRPEKAQLLPGVPQALASLSDAGFRLIVVTNQSGIARGMLDEGILRNIQIRVDTELAEFGVTLDGWYTCPHHPSVGIAPHRRRCRCRKPRPGLLEKAAQDIEIDWSRSVGVGDDVRDLQAFAAMGMPSVLVGTGKGRITRQKLAETGKDPDLYCAHLAEAVPWILARANKQ
ncbi:MAG TPA: D,D-heptose 1,7-bisphosphate phosphatase [Planctomycetes bacterium]|nr:D,D-heptose 1,7-bisphosphate phosphatase [Planctomycetota bacterium]